MTAAIRTLITVETGFTGDLEIEFGPELDANNLIIIRPSNNLSRALSTKWIVVMLWILMVYPFIWLWKQFNEEGGGIWKVCGGGYPLKVMRVIPHQQPFLVDVGTSGTQRFSTTYTEEVTGEREGAWFKRWEQAIRKAVVGKKNDSVTLVHPEDYQFSNADAGHLDGYQEV